MLKEKLGHHPVKLQVPIGAEDKFAGHHRRDHRQGVSTSTATTARSSAKKTFPPSTQTRPRKPATRSSSASPTSTTSSPRSSSTRSRSSTEELRAAIRRATLALKMTPVMCGSAFKNKGVQLLLDGVVALPAEPDGGRQRGARSGQQRGRRSSSSPTPTKPFVGLAFKLQQDKYGQLTYFRVYQGSVTAGDTIYQHLEPEPQGARAAHVPHALGRPRGDRDGRSRRHRRVLRRRGELRRNLHRRQGQLHPDVDARARRRSSRSRSRRRTATAETQLLQGAEPLHQGRSDLPRAPGRRVAADHHQRHGRAAPRHLHGAHAPRVQLRGHRRQAAGGVPRDDHPARARSPTRTRSRPVAPASSRA